MQDRVVNELRRLATEKNVHIMLIIHPKKVEDDLNLNVASILGGKKDFEVIVAGGLVRSRDMGITGEATIDFIRQFKVDFGIIGVSGIDSDGSLLDFDYNEVRVSREIISNSRKIFLVADNSKFGRNAMVRLGHINEIDAIFTGSEPPDVYREAILSSDTELVMAL